jgi:TP901 family phage tail tape measure protein/lambda family phage tail tape measure protein
MTKQEGMLSIEATLSMATGKFKKDMANTKKDMKSFTNKMKDSFEDVNKSIFNTQNLLVGLGTGSAIVALKRLSNVAEVFEFGLVGVGKTTDITGEALANLGREIQSLSLEIPVATNQMLNMAEVAGQLGVKGERNILSFTSAISKLRLATDLTNESFAAASLARILTVTDTELGKVENFASSITKLGNNFAATESEITNVATRVAQTTAQFNTSAADVAAISATLRAAGERAEAGGSAIGIFFRKMNRAIRVGGKEFQRIQAITGKSQAELLKTLKNNSTDAFVEILRGLKKLDAVGIEDFFDDLKINTNEVNRVVTPLIKNLDDLERALDMSRAEFLDPKELDREVEQFSNTFFAKMTLLQNGMNKLFQGLGQVLNSELIPILDRLSRVLSDNTSLIVELFKKYKNSLIALAAIPAIAALSAGFVKIAVAVASILAPLAKFVGFFAKFTPVGRAIGLITAAFFGLSSMVRDNGVDSIVEFEETWVDKLDNTLEKVRIFKEELKDGFDLVVDINVPELGNEVKSEISAIKKELSSAFSIKEKGDVEPDIIGGVDWGKAMDNVFKWAASVSLGTEEMERLSLAQQRNAAAVERDIIKIKALKGETESFYKEAAIAQQTQVLYNEALVEGGVVTEDQSEEVKGLTEEYYALNAIQRRILRMNFVKFLGQQAHPLQAISNHLKALNKQRKEFAKGFKSKSSDKDMSSLEGLDKFTEKISDSVDKAKFELQVLKGAFGGLDESILKTVYSLGLIDANGNIAESARELIAILSEKKAIEDANEVYEKRKEILADLNSELAMAKGEKSLIDQRLERIANSLGLIGANGPTAKAQLEEIRQLLFDIEIAKAEKKNTADSAEDLFTQEQLDRQERANELMREVLTPLQLYNEQMAELNSLYQEGLIYPEQYGLLVEKLKEQLKDATSGPLTEFADSLQQSFSRVSDSMVDALVKGEDAMETFKNAFKAFAADIVKELIRIFVIQQLVGMVGNMFGGGGGSAGGVGNGGGIAGANPSAPFSPGAGSEVLLGSRSASAGSSGQTIIIDARGSNGDEAVKEAVMRGINEAAPKIVNQAKIETTSNILDINRRQPRVFS